METTRLIDPGFWADDSPCTPGAEFPEVLGDLPGLVFFRTSGSTGFPKWIGLSREALLFSAAVVNRHLHVGEADVWGLLLPVNHVGGFGVVARAFEAGCRLSRFPGKWHAGEAAEWLAREGVTHCPMVPTQVHDLVAQAIPAPPGIRTVVVGGGVLHEDTGRAARALGWPVLASYGMTEAGSQIATQPIELLEAPYVTSPIEILPHWTVSTGDQDRLCISGPSLFSGFLLQEEDGLRYSPRVGDELETSDRVEVSGGSLKVLGRADRRVKVLGELVDLDEIERSIGGDVMVLALPEVRRGSELVAVGSEAGFEARCGRHNGSVPGPWRISRSVTMTELPRTPLGKPDRAKVEILLRNS